MPDLVQAIGLHSERLLEKALTNVDITCAFRWLVEQLGMEMTNARANLANLRLEPIEVHGEKLITKVSYIPNITVVRGLPDYPDATDFISLMAKENEYLWKCIKINPSFLEWLHDLVQVIQNYCDHKGKKFEEFEFATYDRFLTKDGRTFILTLT